MKGTSQMYLPLGGVVTDSRSEGCWSECFQDLGSWCRPPPDELNTPQNINQNEFNFSFDEKSKVYKWDSSSALDLHGDMWQQSDNLESPLRLQEDNTLQTPTFPVIEKSLLLKDILKDEPKESPIIYTGNLLLTQCSYDTKNCNMDTIMDEEKPLEIQDTPRSSPSDMGLQDIGLDMSWEQFGCLEEEEDAKPLVSVEPVQTALKKRKPALKLDMSAATKATSNPPAEIKPMMSTPDVLKSLTAFDSGFSLINFVCEGFDDQNLIAVDPASIGGQEKSRIVNNLSNCSQQADPDSINIDHDYTEAFRKPVEPIIIKTEKEDVEELEEDEEEDETMMKYSPKQEDEEEEEDISTRDYFSIVGSTRRPRRLTATSDDIFDSDPPSDHSSDWSPSSSYSTKKSKTTRKKSSKASKRSRKSSESDNCSIISGPDRYRELRDRNNEASRRSRMNRKQRELEMLERASKLQDENILLRHKAINLEKRVKALRDILLKVVLTRKT